MLYRKMNKAAPGLSILGFGCMRLPTTEDGKIDEEQATGMLRYAIDHGVNYVDTAYPYHNGESEPFVGRALGGGYARRCTSRPSSRSWLVRSREDMDRYLDEQLARLKTRTIDFYLVHGLNRPFWENLSALGVTDFLNDAIADGRIRHAGFSFHDNTALFKEIVDGYDWTFAQIQLQFHGRALPGGDGGAGIRGEERARHRGDGADPGRPAGTEPLGYQRDLAEGEYPAHARRMGAPLGLEPPGSDRRPLRHVGTGAGPAECRPRRMRLCGFAEQSGALPVREGQKRAGETDPDPLHRCKYCVPCPHGVSIPECFEMFNRGHIYEDEEQTKQYYSMFLGGFFDGTPHFASLCQECGECEEKCPQSLPIRENLKKVREYFGK